MFIYFIKLDKNFLYKEIGEATSFIIITKEDLTNTKHFGLKLVETGIYIKEKFSNRNIKKINISTTSYIVLMVYILLLTIMFFQQ